MLGLVGTHGAVAQVHVFQPHVSQRVDATSARIGADHQAVLNGQVAQGQRRVVACGPRSAMREHASVVVAVDADAAFPCPDDGDELIGDLDRAAGQRDLVAGQPANVDGVATVRGGRDGAQASDATVGATADEECRCARFGNDGDVADRTEQHC